MFYCVRLWITHAGIHESGGWVSILNRQAIAILRKYQWMDGKGHWISVPWIVCALSNILYQSRTVTFKGLCVITAWRWWRKGYYIVCGSAFRHNPLEGSLETSNKILEHIFLNLQIFKSCSQSKLAWKYAAWGGLLPYFHDEELEKAHELSKIQCRTEM